eukprot:TRINITY_DN49273_c0_g1_i1.p1 TRINITY_DN49273_c0_g1~~TRINITY_DN49273_c0_g1_i1.p1  ORF type:complete len:192 (-),score=51.74 TRINITY_DN49273_c0_g1_i1:577-1152(-)
MGCGASTKLEGEGAGAPPPGGPPAADGAGGDTAPAPGSMEHQATRISCVADVDMNSPRDPNELDDFEDFGEDTGKPTAIVSRLSKFQQTGLEAGVEWVAECQKAWKLRGEHCTLTTFISIRTGDHKFEIILPSGVAPLTIECTQEQFDEVLNEQPQHDSPTERIAAAINHMFEEGMDELGPEMTAIATGGK